MTIDEAIKHQRDIAEKYKYQLVLNETGHPMYALGDRVPIIEKYVEEYTQVAEWLEELKQLRAEVAEMHDERQAECAFKREHDEQIRDSAIDDALHRILCLASHKADFYSLENGEMIEAMKIEDIDKMIYEELAEQLKENSNGS